MGLNVTPAAPKTHQHFKVVIDPRDDLGAACLLGHDPFYPQVGIDDVSPQHVRRLADHLYEGKTDTEVARIGVLNSVAEVSTLHVQDSDGDVRAIGVELGGDRKAPTAWISVDGIPVARSTPEAGLRPIERRMSPAWCDKAFALVSHALRVIACCRRGGLALEKRSDGLKSGEIPNEPKPPRRDPKRRRTAPNHFRRGCVIIYASGYMERRSACYVNCVLEGGSQGRDTMYIVVGASRARQLRRGFSIDRDRRVTISRGRVEATLRRIGCAVPTAPAALAASAAALVIALAVLDRRRDQDDPHSETLLAAWLQQHAPHVLTACTPDAIAA